MDISIKQEKWRQERPLFEAEFIHSHLLPYFNFNESTGDYEIKSEVEFNEDEDRKLAYEVLNTGWVMWLRAKRDGKAQAVQEWISVEDCLPNFGDDVLLYSNGYVLVGEYLPAAVNEFNIQFDEGFWVNNGASIISDTTHWMPLPKPPTKECK